MSSNKTSKSLKFLQLSEKKSPHSWGFNPGLEDRRLRFCFIFRQKKRSAPKKRDEPRVAAAVALPWWANCNLARTERGHVDWDFFFVCVCVLPRVQLLKRHGCLDKARCLKLERWWEDGSFRSEMMFSMRVFWRKMQIISAYFVC